MSGGYFKKVGEGDNLTVFNKKGREITKTRRGVRVGGGIT